MPRASRVTMDNAVYHIITRGNQKQTVFADALDYSKYLSILTTYKKRYQFKLYCFCLMPNHVHLIIEVEDSFTLNKIMRGINLSYTLHFNFKHKKVGHLWQDRFKSKIIERDSYLVECMNYIETNPIRASLVSNLSEYKWSSYNFRITNNPILDKLFSI